MSDRARMFAPVEGLSGEELLSAWRWLVPRGADVLRVTACGDLFYRDATGTIWFLDTVHGRVEQVAHSPNDLEALLEDVGNRRRFLWSFVVRDLYTEDKVLAVNQCYSPKHPVHLGGIMDSDNLEPTDIRVHLGITGQLHQQTKSLTPGAQIKRVRIHGADPGDPKTIQP